MPHRLSTKVTEERMSPVSYFHALLRVGKDFSPDFVAFKTKNGMIVFQTQLWKRAANLSLNPNPDHPILYTQLVIRI